MIPNYAEGLYVILLVLLVILSALAFLSPLLAGLLTGAVTSHATWKRGLWVGVRVGLLSAPLNALVVYNGELAAGSLWFAAAVIMVATFAAVKWTQSKESSSSH